MDLVIIMKEGESENGRSKWKWNGFEVAPLTSSWWLWSWLGKDEAFNKVVDESEQKWKWQDYPGVHEQETLIPAPQGLFGLGRKKQWSHLEIFKQN